jgi:glycosyltransferase involved in cell wall biosynthesis
MRFSVIIPTLNEEKYLGRLLTSLVNQTYKNFEVIVIDGQSTDRTLAVASRFKSKLDLRIIIADRRGTAHQRNLAASHAATDHFIFFDADTQPDPGFLSQIALAIKTHGFQVATAWLNPMSNKLIDKLIFGSYNIFYQETLKKVMPSGTGVFLYVSRPAFQRVGGFNETMCVSEDFDLVHRLHKAKFKFELIRKPSIPFSVRRLDKEGRLRYITNILKSGYYYHAPGDKRYQLGAPEWYKFGHFN